MESKVTIICGPDEISWKTFCKGLETAVSSDERFTRSVGAVQREELITGKLQALAMPDLPTAGKNAASFLFRLLMRYRTRQSTDPRDKIYALFGLNMQHFKDIELILSCRETPSNVFRDTTVFILRGTGDLGVFRALQGPGSTLSTSIPSSVPDWSYIGEFAIPFSEVSGMGKVVSATGSSQYYLASKHACSLLGLLGKLLDAIQKIGDVLPLIGLEGMDIDFKMCWKHLDLAPRLGNSAAAQAHQEPGKRSEWVQKIAGERMKSLLR